MEFRKAERKDVPLILRFIRELAAYENLSAEVVAEEKDLEKWIFDEKKLEAFFVCVDGNEVGIATFYYVFQLFQAAPVYIWKICLYVRNSVEKDTAKLYLKNWPQ